MSAEDRLREILHSEASTLVPSGDGLARIRQRVDRRRRLRLVLLPVGAAAAAGIVVAVIALTGTTGTQRLEQTPVGPASPGGTTAPTHAATTPPTRPSPSAAASYTGPAMWPFTSSAQGRAWTAHHGSRPWAGDPRLVAQHLVTDFLKVTGVSALGSGDTIDLRCQGRDVGLVHLVQISQGGPWTVTAVGGTDLTISSPRPTAAVTSPTQVSGRLQGVDENVRLQLIGSASAHELGATSAPAGNAVPWRGTLTWSDQTWYTAGLVAITRSAKDGSITRITAIPVKRGH